MTEVKVLVFDVFGTVVDWRGSMIAEAQALGAKLGIEADWARLVDDWRGGYHPAMNRVRRGELPWTSLDILHRGTLDRLIDEHGIAGLDDAARTHLNLGWHRLSPWPDSVAGLTRLKSKFIIATLSNGNAKLLVDMAKNAGLPWDTVLSSDLVGHFKPDAEMYQLPVKLFAETPGEVMLVAAHNNDLAAAAKQGLSTAFVARPGEYGPYQSRDTKAEHDFTYVATDFLDLADKLGCAA